MDQLAESIGEPITILSEDQSWNLLSSMALGRLITFGGGQIEIFPVNFVIQRRTILFRTAEGTKLISMVMNDRVVFEADDYGSRQGWSVIVRGQAEIADTQAEIEEAEGARLLPWTATVKLRYVRVVPLEISGRMFRFGAEPPRETGLG